MGEPFANAMTSFANAMTCPIVLLVILCALQLLLITTCATQPFLAIGDVTKPLLVMVYGWLLRIIGCNTQPSSVIRRATRFPLASRCSLHPLPARRCAT